MAYRDDLEAALSRAAALEAECARIVADAFDRAAKIVRQKSNSRTTWHDPSDEGDGNRRRADVEEAVSEAMREVAEEAGREVIESLT